MKTRLVLILDTIFICFISFIIAVILLSYATPHPLSVIYSACVSLLSALFYIVRYNKKAQNVTVKFSQKKQFEDMVEQLNFSSRSEQFAIIEKAITLSGKQAVRKKGKIKVQDTEAVVFIKYGFVKVNKADVLKSFNAISKSETAYILAENFEQEVKDFAERFNGKVKLVSAIPLFNTLKKLDCLPKNKYSFIQQKVIKSGWKNFIDKRKSKKFAIFGLAFLFLSYFSPIKTYYIVFGVIFLCLSLIIKAFGVIPEEKTVYSV